MSALELDKHIADLRARLGALESDVARRDAELARVKHELRALQTRYLEEIGRHYARLDELESAIAAAEIAAGLRPPPEEDAGDRTGEDRDPRPGGEARGDASACGHRGAPSADLKRIFRQLARTIHPDLAPDGAARYRRHSLMAEANRAYAEQDEDRLRLILRRWEMSADLPPDSDEPDSARARLERRIAAFDRHRIDIEAEMADLRTSAIWRLNEKIADAKRQGWDLFAEMVREVTREIRRAEARLAKIARARPDRSAAGPRPRVL